VALAGVNMDLEPGVIGLLGPKRRRQDDADPAAGHRAAAHRGRGTRAWPRPAGTGPSHRHPAPARLPAAGGRLPARVYRSAFIDYIALLKEWAEPTARHAEVRRVLDLVGLSDLATKRIRAMSGGQRRRVADPAATVSWRTGTGRYRNVAAHAGDGVEHVEPSLEDAYLLLRGGSPEPEPTKEGAS
jgi:hypothetical protein